jgi:hypothetical protein
VAEKSHYYTTPCTALWGEGEGGCYFYGPEDLLNPPSPEKIFSEFFAKI